jgi:hypothetical protein
VRSLTLEENPQGLSAVVQPDPIGPMRLEIDRSEINLSRSAPLARGRDACMKSTLGGSIPPWNRSFSMETYVRDEQP